MAEIKITSPYAKFGRSNRTPTYIGKHSQKGRQLVRDGHAPTAWVINGAPYYPRPEGA